MPIGLLWGPYLYAVVCINKRLIQASLQVEAQEKDHTSLKILYNGSSAHSRHKMAHLRRCDRSGAIDFVNIADAGYLPEKYGGITSDEAMQKIHGIDSDGNILQGSHLLARLYARTGRPLRAILLLGYNPIKD